MTLSISAPNYRRLRFGVGGLLTLMGASLLGMFVLGVFTEPAIRELTGPAPLVEFFVLGGIALAAFVLSPKPS